MSEPDWNAMNPDQKLEALYQPVHALVVEVGGFGVKVSRIESDLQHTADRVSALEVRAATRLNWPQWQCGNWNR